MGRRRRKRHSQVGAVLGLILIASAIGSAAYIYHRWVHREQRYNKLILEIGAKYGVDPFLIKAVMRRESEFDPYTAGRAGEVGLMQVMPGTGQDWARANKIKHFDAHQLWDERTNIDAATWYLARALHRWQDKDNPVPFALAEYNAGYGNCLHWLPHGETTTAGEFCNAITYPSVRKYIETVTEFRDYYLSNGEL